MFTNNLFKALEASPRFGGLEGLTLQLNAAFLKDKEKRFQLKQVKEIIGKISDKLS